MESSPLTKKRSLYLDVARVVAIISITLNHAVNRTYENYTGQQAEFLAIPFGDTLIKVVITIFSKVGVPLFLMISGALLMNKRMDGPEDVKRFYKHNLLSLLITTEIWYFIMYWCRIILGIGDQDLATMGIGNALLGMVKTMLFLEQNTFASMWYMPMILCVYTTLPFLIIVKDKLGECKKLLWIPAGLVFVYVMVLPAVSALSWLTGGSSITTVIREANLIPFYYLYVLAGYFISTGCLKKLKDWTVVVLTLLSFALCCGIQLFSYAQPKDYLIGYDFPLLLVYGSFLFEWMRRKSHRAERCRGAITYLSKISLGIYFVHIFIVTVLNRLLGDMGRTEAWRLLLLEVVPVGSSIAIIAVLSKIKLFRKYLFGIK